MSTENVQVAREHLARGEAILANVEEMIRDKPDDVPWDFAAPQVGAQAALASAHFAASMAITNLLLTPEDSVDGTR